jgi:hypothetical protein
MLTASFITLFWLVLVPVNVLSVQLNPMGNAYTISPTHTKRGGAVNARVSYCKEDWQASTVRAWLEIGSALYELDSTWAELPPGCHNSVLSVAPIPESLSVESTYVGRARIRVDKYYRIRGQVYSYRLYSDYFWIEE